MELSLPWLLACSGGFAVFLIPTAFSAISMTKVSPRSFQVARFCFIATGIVPAITVWYSATQFQVPYWARVGIFILGFALIGLPIACLLRLVNENEKAHNETREREGVSKNDGNVREIEAERVRRVIDQAATLIRGAPNLHPLQAILLAGAANLSSNEDVVEVNNDISNRGSGSALNDTAIRRENYLSFLKFSAKEKLQLRNRVETYEATRLYYLQPLSASISREQCFDNAARLLKTCREYLDSFNAIYCAHAAELGSSEEVVWVSKQLKEHGYDHPFTAIHIYVPVDEWLEFLRWGRHHAKYNFERDNDYLNAAQEWSKLKGHKKPSKAVQDDFELYKAMHKRLD